MNLVIPRIELLLIFKLFTVVLLVNTASKSHLIFIAKRCALQLISNCNILREGMLVFPVFIIQKSDIIWPSFKWKNHEIASRKFLFCSYFYQKPLVNLKIPKFELLFIFKLFTVVLLVKKKVLQIMRKLKILAYLKRYHFMRKGRNCLGFFLSKALF